MKRRLLPVLLLAALLYIFASAASAETLKGLTRVEAADTAEFEFTPKGRGEYGVYFFPNVPTGTTSAELYIGSNLMRQGSGSKSLMRVLLADGKTYRIVLRHNTGGYLEIVPQQRNRCFDDPLVLLNEEPYRKKIARTGNVHWYRYEPTRTGRALVWVDSRELSNAEARAFTESGVPIGVSQSAGGSSAVLEFACEEDVAVLLRIVDLSGATGIYTVTARDDASRTDPTRFELAKSEITLNGYEAAAPTPIIEPRDACALFYLKSDDESIVRVLADNAILGVAPGTTKITLYGCSGLTTSCTVKVREVPADGISLKTDTVRMRVGDTEFIDAHVTPFNTTQRTLKYASSDPTVLKVSEAGEMTAMQEGRVRVTVYTPDRRYFITGVIDIEKANPKYRALLIGEENYASTVEVPRKGSSSSVEDMAVALQGLSFEGGESYKVHMVFDKSRDGIVARIRRDFKDATDGDVSLFYINCHGFNRLGTTNLLMVDGSVLSAVELAEELRKIPGTVIVLLDCCTSGGAIGEATLTPEVNSGVNRLYNGLLSPSLFADSRFYVLTSARLEQDSYRTGTSEGSLRTVFVRAFTRAAAPKGMSFQADLDGDGRVTFTELVQFMKRTVATITTEAKLEVQAVCASPESGSLVVFDRVLSE